MSRTEGKFTWQSGDAGHLLLASPNGSYPAVTEERATGQLRFNGGILEQEWETISYGFGYTQTSQKHWRKVPAIPSTGEEQSGGGTGPY